MNKVFAVFFAFLIFGIAAKDFMVYTHFKLDQNFIVSVLCINKDKPSLQCDGKCYLKQKLKENHTEEEQELPISLEERRSIHLFIAYPDNLFLSPLEEKVAIAYQRTFLIQLLIEDHFRPPELLA